MGITIKDFEAENVKRIRAVKLHPSPTGLTIIGGNNGQGKTSVLDSIAWALGGEAYGFEPEFLKAVNGGCYGLMQVSTYWHADRMERLGVTESQIWEAGPTALILESYIPADDYFICGGSRWTPQ